MIAGAGPAGMECAYVAAQRGHEVHIYDKRELVGAPFWRHLRHRTGMTNS